MTSDGPIVSISLPTNGRNRRMFLFAAHTGEGHLTDPTTAVRPRRRELLFMPRRRPFSIGANGRPRSGAEPRTAPEALDRAGGSAVNGVGYDRIPLLRSRPGT